MYLPILTLCIVSWVAPRFWQILSTGLQPRGIRWLLDNLFLVLL